MGNAPPKPLIPAQDEQGTVVGKKGPPCVHRYRPDGSVGQAFLTGQVTACEQVSKIVQCAKIALENVIRLRDQFINFRLVSNFRSIVRPTETEAASQQYGNAHEHRLDCQAHNCANDRDQRGTRSNGVE